MYVHTKQDWDEVQRRYADGLMSDAEYERTMNRADGCCRSSLPTATEWIAQKMYEQAQRRKKRAATRRRRKKMPAKSQAQARLMMAKYRRGEITLATLRKFVPKGTKLKSLPQYVGGRRPKRKKFCVQFGKRKDKRVKSGVRRFCKHFAWHGGRPPTKRSSTVRKRTSLGKRSRRGTTYKPVRRSRVIRSYYLRKPRVSWKRSASGKHRVRTLAFQKKR